MVCLYTRTQRRSFNQCYEHLRQPRRGHSWVYNWDAHSSKAKGSMLEGTVFGCLILEVSFRKGRCQRMPWKTRKCLSSCDGTGKHLGSPTCWVPEERMEGLRPGLSISHGLPPACLWTGIRAKLGSQNGRLCTLNPWQGLTTREEHVLAGKVKVIGPQVHNPRVPELYTNPHWQSGTRCNSC